MFGVGFGEVVVIFIVALLLFGPEKLPEIARSLGEFMAHLRRTSDQLKDEFYREFSAPTQKLREYADTVAVETRQLADEVKHAPERALNKLVDKTPPQEEDAPAKEGQHE